MLLKKFDNYYLDYQQARKSIKKSLNCKTSDKEITIKNNGILY